MRIVFTLVLLLIVIAVTGYAHWQLARQTPTPSQRWLGHGLVGLVAIAFGWAVAGVYMGGEEGGGVAAFLVAIGVAHLPPAIVLFLKKQRDK